MLYSSTETEKLGLEQQSPVIWLQTENLTTSSIFRSLSHSKVFLNQPAILPCIRFLPKNCTQRELLLLHMQNVSHPAEVFAQRHHHTGLSYFRAGSANCCPSQIPLQLCHILTDHTLDRMRGPPSITLLCHLHKGIKIVTMVEVQPHNPNLIRRLDLL